MGLLASSSFSKHLSAVRETNNLLMRALNVRQYDDGESIKVCTKKTLIQKCLSCPLRTRLHGKGYFVLKAINRLSKWNLQQDFSANLASSSNQVKGRQEGLRSRRDILNKPKSYTKVMLGRGGAGFLNGCMVSCRSMLSGCARMMLSRICSVQTYIRSSMLIRYRQMFLTHNRFHYYMSIFSILPLQPINE